MVTTGGAAHPTGRPLQPQGCYASLTRPPYGRPWTLEPNEMWMLLAGRSRVGESRCHIGYIGHFSLIGTYLRLRPTGSAEADSVPVAAGG
jgi:hypothetical protein